MSAWQSVKGEYWSLRGVVVTTLHNVTAVAALLIAIGAYTAWHGYAPWQAPSSGKVAAKN